MTKNQVFPQCQENKSSIIDSNVMTQILRAQDFRFLEKKCPLKSKFLLNGRNINLYLLTAMLSHCLDLNINDQKKSHFYLCIPGISSTIYPLK